MARQAPLVAGRTLARLPLQSLLTEGPEQAGLLSYQTSIACLSNQQAGMGAVNVKVNLFP